MRCRGRAPVERRRRGRARRAAAAAALALAGCVDFVAVEEPRSTRPAAAMSVASSHEGDSIVVSLDAQMLGFADPPVTLAGVATDVLARRGDSLHLGVTVVLPPDASRAELAVPYSADGFGGSTVVRVGMVRAVGPAAWEEGDLMLPWQGPNVPETRGSWRLVIEGGGRRLLELSGPGGPPRPLRVPGELLEAGPKPARARFRLARHVEPDTFYPFALGLTGETTWELAGPPADP